MYNYGLTREFRNNMEKVLWVVEFMSYNYTSNSEYCIVWADSEYNAHVASAQYTEDFFFDKDYEQFLEDTGNLDCDIMWATTVEVTRLSSEQNEDILANILDTKRYPIIN